MHVVVVASASSEEFPIYVNESRNCAVVMAQWRPHDKAKAKAIGLSLSRRNFSSENVIEHNRHKKGEATTTHRHQRDTAKHSLRMSWTAV